VPKDPAESPIFGGTLDKMPGLGSAAEITERGNFPDFRPYLGMPPQEAKMGEPSQWWRMAPLS
jgi:hypothetical protein